MGVTAGPRPLAPGGSESWLRPKGSALERKAPHPACERGNKWTDEPWNEGMKAWSPGGHAQQGHQQPQLMQPPALGYGHLQPTQGWTCPVDTPANGCPPPAALCRALASSLWEERGDPKRRGPYPARPTHTAPLSASPPLPSAGHAHSLHSWLGEGREGTEGKLGWCQLVSRLPWQREGGRGGAAARAAGKQGMCHLLAGAKFLMLCLPNAAQVTTQPNRGRGRRGAGEPEGVGPTASLALLGTAAAHSLLAGWCSLMALAGHTPSIQTWRTR